MRVITEATGTTATENTKEGFSEEESTSEESIVCLVEGSTSVASTVCSEAKEASMACSEGNEAKACSDERSGNDPLASSLHILS
jgi:hypothetical protein